MEENFFVMVSGFYESKAVLQSRYKSLHDGSEVGAPVRGAVSEAVLSLYGHCYQLFSPFYLKTS